VFPFSLRADVGLLGAPQIFGLITAAMNSPQAVGQLLSREKNEAGLYCA